jgi:predicted ATPase/DNA-binding CsgD family transcriptional regulator
MHAQPLESLTDREREILACLAQRLSNQEIADKLYLSIKTVKWYNTQIFEKLGVKNRAEAIKFFTSTAHTGLPTQPRTTFPAQVTPFIGRETEVRDLSSLLHDPNVRIITILAPGGMGKTRLAIESATRSAEQLAAQAYFVPLTQIVSPADLVTAIGSALGLSFYSAGEAKKQLFDFLRGQNVLLVLDNFEHLLAGALLVAELVAAVPGVKVMITSREKLYLSGETIYRLDGMRVPESSADPLALNPLTFDPPEFDLLTFDSVQLFLYQARRVQRSFTVDDAASIVRIAQLTQGMPLGLVLAGAWADVLSPVQIADEISHGLDVLQQEFHDVPARHRSVRAVFDPTWERLNESQRELFMKLSVFRGGFTHEAAQAVAAGDPRMLFVLVGKSLIQPQPNQRFTIHELLRQYGESHAQRLLYEFPGATRGRCQRAAAN